MSSSFDSLAGLIKTFSLTQLFHAVTENRTLSLGIFLGLVVLYIAHYITSPYRKLPPGPRGYPIIGNVLELRGQQWFKFTEWRKQYGQRSFNNRCIPHFSLLARLGDLVYINAAGQPMVILNSQKVAADLLDRRAGIYSDRPRNIVASDIMTGGLLVVFTRYNDVCVLSNSSTWYNINRWII
jgi:hypothetical protein